MGVWWEHRLYCMIYIMNEKLINALKKTASELKNGCKYEWGHMGRCNAGCVVQHLMDKTDTQVAEMVGFKLDEWSEYAKTYCQDSYSDVDELFASLKRYGLGYQDMIHIEYLSDPKVLEHLPEYGKNLKKNNPQDVSNYLLAFANKLERELALIKK